MLLLNDEFKHSGIFFLFKPYIKKNEPEVLKSSYCVRFVLLVVVESVKCHFCQETVT